MADFTKKFGNIVNLFQSSQNSLNKCMDICSKELEELFNNYENLISIQETNRVLKEELIQKDTIINNLLAKDNNFNNVSMLKKQDKQICDLTNQVAILEKQIKYYKDLSQTNSELNDTIELYVNNQIDASSEILNVNEDKYEEPLNAEDNISIKEEEEPSPKENKSKKPNKEEKSTKKEKSTTKKEKSTTKKEKSTKKDKSTTKKEKSTTKKEKATPVNDTMVENNTDTSDISSKLTLEEEEDLDMFEDVEGTEYYIHHSSNRIFTILDKEGNIGDLVGIMKNGKFEKFNN